MPMMPCSPGSFPLITADSSGSAATTRRPGNAARSAAPTPISVPPVPTPATKAPGGGASSASSWARISGPVVSWWQRMLSGFENWSGT